MPAGEPSTSKEATLTPYSQIILPPAQFGLPNEPTEVAAFKPHDPTEFQLETTRATSYIFEETDGTRWRIRHKKTDKKITYYKYLEDTDVEIELGEKEKLLTEIKRFCYDSALLAEYITAEVFALDDLTRDTIGKTEVMLNENCDINFGKHSKLTVEKSVKQTANRSITWTTTEFRDIRRLDSAGNVVAEDEIRKKPDSKVEITRTVWENEDKITRHIQPIAITLFNARSTQLIANKAPEQYRPIVTNRNLSVELLNHMAAFPEQENKILNAHKKYQGNGKSDPARSSTQQYFAELKQINAENKPGLIESLLGSFNILQTTRYKAYHSLATSIATMEQDWRHSKSQKMQRLERKIEQNPDAPSSIVDRLHLGSTMLKLGGLVDKAEGVYKKIIEKLNQETQQKEQKDLATQIDKLKNKKEKIEAELKQLALNHADRAYLKLRQWRSSLNNKIKSLDDYSDEILKKEINQLKILLQAIEIRLVMLNDPNSISLYSIIDPLTQQPIPISKKIDANGTTLELQNKETFEPDFLILFDNIMAIDDAEHLYDIVGTLLDEQQNREHFLELRKNYFENEQRILLNDDPKLALSVAEKAKYNELHSKLKAIQLELTQAKGNLKTFVASSPTVANYLTATEEGPRNHIPTNHSNLLFNMREHFREVKKRKKIEEKLSELLGEDNEPTATPTPASTAKKPLMSS